MFDNVHQGRKELHELMRGGTPLFIGGHEGSVDDQGQVIDPASATPLNIPALVIKHLEATGEPGGERMRSFTLRIEDYTHDSLVRLAEVLGTSKTTLARELLEMAVREAYASLPDDVRAKVWPDEGEAS